MGRVLVWVLYLVTPGTMPDIPISAPLLTIEECHEREVLVQAPFPAVCMPQYLSWGDLA